MDTNTAVRPNLDRSRGLPRNAPPSATLMDVTLRRGSEFQRWRIRRRDTGWDFQFQATTTVTVSGSETVEGAFDQKHRWEADIVAAMADGWA